MLQDPGTFWHLVLGEWLLTGGELTRHDSFTFTFDGRPWLSLQWLGEAAMAAAFRAGGSGYSAALDGDDPCGDLRLAGGTADAAPGCTGCRPPCWWPW